jgi:hypothetical protein
MKQKKDNLILLMASLFFAFFISFSLNAQNCNSNEIEVAVQITPDNYPNETSWQIADATGNIVANGNAQSQTICLPNTACYTFTIFDSYDDGICCNYGQGSYAVIVDSDTIITGGNFTTSESVNFNCSVGSVCDNPFVISEGTYLTGTTENWYAFTPDSSGLYTISTCNAANTCGTKLWIYDYCTNLLPDSTNVATIYYSTGGCSNNGNLATIDALFAANTTYYIRTKSLCAAPIQWSLMFDSYISGCTDPNACNYNPLATISDTCIYFGDPNCPNGPDLTVIQSDIVNSLQLDVINNIDQCTVQEGCLTGYGQRYVLRFDTHIENIGSQDFYIGVPPASITQQSTQWEWDPCHAHWHYEGYAEYVLFDTLGNLLPVGFKNGFCVMDLDCSMNGGTEKYGCGNQGISSNCGDIYDSYLDCQWIDVTDLPADLYTFVVRVNWDKSPDQAGRYETGYQNNWAQVCINLTRDPITNVPSVTLAQNCQPYTDCNGELYGNARPDCTGECEGLAVAGDLIADTVITNADIIRYMEEIITDTLSPIHCNDLNDDNKITVTDAAFLQNCLLNVNNPNYTGNQTPCEYYQNIINPTDFVNLSLGNITTQYFDVFIQNPHSATLAFEFSLKNMTIDSVQNMLTNYNPSIFHNDNTIAGMDFSGSSIIKNIQPTLFLRVYYQNMIDSICIDEIIAVVNDDLEESTTAATGNCLFLTNTNQITDLNDLNVRIMPNPFSDKTTLRFDNPTNSVFQLELIDMSGKVINTFYNIRQNEVQISRENMASGVYFYRLFNGEKVNIGKLIIE